jgi:hypothetical protein
LPKFDFLVRWSKNNKPNVATSAAPLTPTTPTGNNNSAALDQNASSLTTIKLSNSSIDMGSPNEEEEEESRRIAAVLKRKYESLGPVSFAELTSGLSFVVLIILWVLRQPGFIPGWSDWFAV